MSYKMKVYTVKYTIRVSEVQDNSLKELKKHGVVISKFIRQAIKEKIQRDWKNIKTEFQKSTEKCPF